MSVRVCRPELFKSLRLSLVSGVLPLLLLGLRPWTRALSVERPSSNFCVYVWPTFTPLCSDQSSAGAVRETVYRRWPGLPSRRTHHLEQPAGQRDICPVSVNLPSAFKNISVPGLVP